jgi:hypothetical protein
MKSKFPFKLSSFNFLTVNRCHRCFLLANLCYSTWAVGGGVDAGALPAVDAGLGVIVVDKVE